MKLRSIGQRVLLERVKASKTTASGLYIESNERSNEGVIVDGEALSLTPGTRVVFDGGRAVGATGLLAVDVDNVLAIYEGG